MTDEPINDAPLKHIRRRPLPWRDSGLTECGRLASSFGDEIVITSEGADALIRKYGSQRSAFLLCVTCMGRFHGWANPWRGAKGLFTALQREGDSRQGLADVNLDLAALAQLVTLHRGDYDRIRAALVAGVTAEEMEALGKLAQRQVPG